MSHPSMKRTFRFLELASVLALTGCGAAGVDRESVGEVANDEIVDLYPRVPVGTKVIVQQ